MQTKTYQVYGDEDIILAKKRVKYRAKPSLLKHCENFLSLFDFADKIVSKGKWADYVSINKVPFTMEEYDHDGQSMVWANKKLDLQIFVTHFNRYKDATGLVSVLSFSSGCFRDDINYLE